MLENLNIFLISIPYIFLYIGMVYVSSLIYSKLTGLKLVDIVNSKSTNEVDTYNYPLFISYIGYILISMFIALDAMTGESHNSLFVDLTITICYFLISQIVLISMRVLIEKMVNKYHTDTFLDEIINQRNYAIAFFEVAIYVLIAGILTGYDYTNFELVSYIVYIGFILFCVSLSLFSFFYFMVKEKNYIKEILEYDNPAAGILFLGFSIYIATIINQVFDNTNFDVLNIIMYVLICNFVIHMTHLGLKVSLEKRGVTELDKNGIFSALLFSAIYITTAQLISILF